MANTNNKTAAEAVTAVATSAQAVAPAGDNSAVLQEQVNQLTTELASAKRTIVDLEGQLDQERAQSGEVSGELNEAQGLIEELTRQLAQSQTIQAESGVVVVSDGTNHYRVIAPKFRHKHVDYTAEELRGNEELVQELVKADVGFLVKVETEK